MHILISLIASATFLAAPSSAIAQTLAIWEYSLAPTIKSENTLVYRDGSVVLESTYTDGSSGTWMVVERPTDVPDERRFDFEDSERSEYLTLSKSGDVKYFSWEGRQFGSARVETIHADVLTIGVNVATRGCTPKELSEASRKAIQLYEELHGFKDDAEFARMGFGRGGSYYLWLQKAKALHAESSMETYQELGFLAGEVMQLGMEYMQVATRRSGTSEYIDYMEKMIQEGVALATCQ